MPRSDFPTSAEYHADADVRAGDLLNSQIALIDAALSFMDQRKAAYLPSIYAATRTQLVGLRNNATWYLSMPDNGGETAIGMMGPNGAGPLITRLIGSADFHANRVRYVPPVLRDGRVAA